MKQSVRMRLREKCWLAGRLISELGLWGGMAYLYRRKTGARGALSLLRPRQAVHPLYFRRGTSDSAVFNQIFLRREYEPLLGMPDVRLVVDCGANVGYSSAFFLSQFPSCRVIAVEPDAGNFAMLQRNLQPYGDRVKVVHAGVWSHSTPLMISRGEFGDGQEWSFQVRPCEPHEEPEFSGVSIESLLSASGFDRISILKIDIEGAEAVVFGGPVDWLDRVDAIAIELHDDSQFGKASDLFHSAIRGQEFQVSHNEELTICRRPGQARHAT